MTTTPNPTAELVIDRALKDHKGRYRPVNERTAAFIKDELLYFGLLAEGAPSDEPRGINLMRDLGFDESDPEVVKARVDAAFEEQIERVRIELHRVMASQWAVIANALKMDQGQYDSFLHDLARSALTAAGATPQEPSESTPINGKWVCGKCAREVARGEDDGQIPEHHRTCPKRDTAPSAAREKLVTEREETVQWIMEFDVSRKVAERGVDSLIEAALAAQPMLDPEKVAEAFRDRCVWNPTMGAHTIVEGHMPLAARSFCEAAKRGELS